MAWLVKPEVRSSGQANAGRDSPLGMPHSRMFYTSGSQFVQGIGQLVAKEINRAGGQLLSGMGLGGTRVGRVYTQLRGRQGENEPSSARIDVGKPEDIPEKGPIRFGIAAIEKQVGAENHGRILVSCHLHRRGNSPNPRI